MRELLFKNSLSCDKKRSELFQTEYFETENSILNFEKKTTYMVKDILEFTDIFDLELYLAQKKKKEIPPQTFIVKNCDKRKARIKIIYKTLSHQHVVLGQRIFVLKVVQFIRKTVSFKKQLLSANIL